MSREWPESWLRQQIKQAGIGLVLCEDSEDRIKDLSVCFVDQLIDEERKTPVNSQPVLNSDQPAYIRFTSGSTGRPKGAVISRRAMENHFRWIDRYYGVTTEDRMLFVSQFTFDLTILDIALLVLKQPDFYFSEFEHNAFRLVYEMEKYKITAIIGAPNLFNLIVNDEIVNRVDKRFLRNIVIAGSRFPYGLYIRLRKHFPHACVDNSYGPTEATNLVSSKRLTWDESEDMAERNVSIGQAVDNMTLHLFDGDKREITTSDTAGELWIAGVQLMDGYINDPERTLESLCEVEGTRYYRSGDLAYFNERGDFFIIGRVGDTVKVKGHRINLLDIDSQLQTMEGIQDCATVASGEGDQEYTLVCYVVASGDIEKKMITNHLRQRLPREQIPKHIQMVGSLPITQAGKVDRKRLAEQFAQDR